MAQPSAEKTPSIYLYIPNIIGYFRIIINFIAFAVCYSNRPLFAILYFFSFFCDGLDGWFARKFNQDEKSASLLDVCRSILKQSPLIAFVFISTLVGWALKQVINVIQMKTAADACVVFDLKRGK